MIFNLSGRILVTFCAITILNISAPGAFAAQKSPVKSIGADIPIEQRMQALQKASEASCPQPLEHVLPGAYYECVGNRDLARGNTDRARGMLETAASWGSKRAQFILGIGYYKGDVQPLDRGLGLAWLYLAAERGKPAYVTIFNSAWRQASLQERERGNALWKSMLLKYDDKHAARRAQRRYNYERVRLTANAVYGARICFQGSDSMQVESGVVGADVGGELRRDGTEGSKKEGYNPRCNSLPVEYAAKVMDHYADRLLDGWEGHVTVGPLQQASPPSR